ncbi:MAG: DUF5675 family protein [Gammaproteobacteria bacterium]|nr:DUF5675 family protein [Gammaproteobacteria bacterium]
MKLWIFAKFRKRLWSINPGIALALLAIWGYAIIQLLQAPAPIIDNAATNMHSPTDWTLRRRTYDIIGMFGLLTIDAGIEIPTIEHPQFLIPPGRYDLKLTWSNKFGRLTPEITNVHKRSGIRIHGGHTWRESDGCILIPPHTTPIIHKQLQGRTVRLYIH